MGSFEIPYHPDADQTTDSIIRIDACVTRLEKLRDVIADWLNSCPAPDGKAAVQPCNPPACLAAIVRRINITLDRIEKGRRRPSGEFAAAVGWVDKHVRAHQHQFVGVATRADKTYGRRMHKALSEAVDLRDRIAYQ